MSWHNFTFLSTLKQFFYEMFTLKVLDSAQTSKLPQSKTFQPQDLSETEQPIPRSDTNNIFIHAPIDPQASCPFFNNAPPEIRNYIFRLALTSFDDKTRPYKKGAYYYRPGYRYAHQIDTSLLRTCRRIYAETKDVPVRLNEHTSWYQRPPPDVSKNALKMDNSPASVVRRQGVQTIHLFTQQFWLESQFEGFTHRWKFTNATRLIITLRHTDFWWWENEDPIALDPKCRRRPSACNPKAGPSDPFEEHSWGIQFRNISGLREFQLELETVAKKKDELDAIVTRAPGWEFPLGDGNVLVLNQSRTTRQGWVGHRLGSNQNEGNFDDLPAAEESDKVPINSISETADGTSNLDITNITHQSSTAATTSPQSHDTPNLDPHPPSTTSIPKAPVKPATTKEKLVADGVRFIDEDREPNLPDEERMTYYVVTLTWHPRAVTDRDVRYDLRSGRGSRRGVRKVKGVRW